MTEYVCPHCGKPLTILLNVRAQQPPATQLTPSDLAKKYPGVVSAVYSAPDKMWLVKFAYGCPKFDEIREDVKRVGGLWDPAGKVWVVKEAAK